jgi:quinol monooxygenase YgiN
MNIMKAKRLFALLAIVIVTSSTIGMKTIGNSKNGGSQDKASFTDTKMVIIAKVSVKPEKTKDFIAAAREIIKKSNKEPGCLSYQLYQDPYDASKFVFVEEYQNQAAVDFHFATEHFKAFGPKIGDMVSAPADINVISVAKKEKK